jgi:hypothetical protein
VVARVRGQHGKQFREQTGLRFSPERASIVMGSGGGARRGGCGRVVQSSIGVDVEGCGIDGNLTVVAAGPEVARGMFPSVRNRGGGRS